MSILGKAAKLAVAVGVAQGAYALLKEGAKQRLEAHDRKIREEVLQACCEKIDKAPAEDEATSEPLKAGTNDGKIPDATELLQEVLRPGCDPEHDDARLETLRKHWSSSVVMTDDYTSEKNEQEIAEEDLLPGELAAVTFQIGCYTIRSAQRVYRAYDPGYDPEKEVPATDEDIKSLREKGFLGYVPRPSSLSYAKAGTERLENRLRMTHEISARYKDTAKDQFTYICRAAEARNRHWSESIEAICTVKENADAADEHASLLVLNTFMGDSHDADTWYKLDPDGTMTTLTLHPFDSNRDNARFV